MVVATRAPRGEPLSELNLTPLVDVLLVLLVMLILSVPMATHILSYDLPGEERPLVIKDTRNLLAITANNRLLWNAAPVTESQLFAILRRSAAMKPEPRLEFAPDGTASYEVSARVLRVVRASGVTNFGFVGNERHRDFGR